MFDRFMEPFFPDSMRSFWTEMGGKEPVIDFQDRGDHYMLTAELPGFEKKDVEVKIDSNALELKAERSSDRETKISAKTAFLPIKSEIQAQTSLPSPLKMPAIATMVPEPIIIDFIFSSERASL